MKRKTFFYQGKGRIPLSWIVVSLAVGSGYNVCYARGETGLLSKQNAEMFVNQQKTRIIKGVVKDNTGELVVGANVVEKGTTNGTMTDIDGAFSLSVPADKAVELEISYIGYISQKVLVKGDKITVTLKEDAQALDEVVITGFGLSQKKESLTSAISVIGAKDIARTSASTSSGALVGKIAGVNSRQTDGRPGAATGIQIRNMGTPLYVIDGVQKDEGQFNNIDFNDIESISILKDASASIYGVRAANGVVVVTTKKGRLNTKNTVSINARYGWQSASSFPKPADAPTYISNYIQSETIQGVENRKYSQEDLAKWKQGTEKGYIPFDWYDFIWETSPQAYIGANVSGGSDKVNYYFGVGHLDQQAMIHNYGGFTRTNVQMNIDAQINKRLKVGAAMNGRIEDRENPGVPGGDDYWLPVFGTYRNLPMARPFANDNPKYPAVTSGNKDVNFGLLNYDMSGRYKDTWRVMQLNFNAEYEIIPGLKAKGMMGYYLANQEQNNQEYEWDLYRYDEENDKYIVVDGMHNPYRDRRVRKVEEITTNIQLNYDKNFGKHQLNAVLGMESIKRDQPTHFMHSTPTSNQLHLIDLDELVEFWDDGNNTEARLGYMFRANYNYASRYLLEFSARYDGSWKFPPHHRWGFFPSASAGWRISEEAFWRDNKIGRIVNDFKLRGSYGLLGDDNVNGYSAFGYLSGYDYKNGGSTLDGEYLVGTVPRNLPVTNMSWIKAKILDIGFDASFLNNRLTFSADYFRRTRSGLPSARYDVLIPSETGFDLPNENLNSDVHTGYDLSLRWSDNVDEFYYSVGGNMTYARFLDWNQYKPRFGNSWHHYRNSIDERFGNLNWMLQSAGQFQSWEEIASWPIDNDRQGNKTLRPGDIKYVDKNGDGIINGMDERPLGYREGGTPILNFGLNFSFMWKGFDLAFDLTGGGLNSRYQDYEQRNPFHDGGNNAQYYMEDTWRLKDIWDPNSELIPGKYPTLLVGNSGHSNYWKSDFWMHNVRYLKLRNLEFGYALPKSLLSKAYISDLRIYVSGQNLFTLSNTPGIDPEIENASGLAYPTTRIINIGLNLKF
ncbi:MAG: TonB-dependent receptor [Bacteroidales bacterium]